MIELKYKNKMIVSICKKKHFPPHIEIQKNMLCLKKFNNYMKNVNLKFSHCCVCNEKKIMQILIIHPISNINLKLKNMKSIFKFNPKHHMPNDSDTIPQGLTKNKKHGHP